ncbi:ABC transporter ATP-binding protein [Nocardioides plantarum]|uniref:ABC transporter ATP-binding protein n=1 Tax=Nocardioides plantarum TaxID=29299 RepID=A0ABV5KBD8_9ACTN|nr:ABC transporter ATP-binding protein [Nocardioides plantarum]
MSVDLPALSGAELTLGYRDTTVVHGASVELRAGHVTALVGPNGSGKSTLLRALARLHKAEAGRIVLDDGTSALDLDARAFSRRVTMLGQSRPHPSGLTVRDVVTFGRHPYRRRFGGLADTDREAIDRALDVTGTAPMQGRAVDELSGGELQRVWLATCLAQQTGVLLLDEPTNHLDLRYQVEILDLVRDLADDHDVAVGIVLHDLNHAAGVADTVVLLHQGRVRATGTPVEVLAGELLTDVYGLTIETFVDPDTGAVRTDPRGRHHHTQRSTQRSTHRSTTRPTTRNP